MKFTFDGYANVMNFGGEGQPLAGYSQIFRNGAIEGANAELFEQSRPINAASL
jgi:hypothetical protein